MAKNKKRREFFDWSMKLSFNKKLMSFMMVFLLILTFFQTGIFAATATVNSTVSSGSVVAPLGPGDAQDFIEINVNDFAQQFPRFVPMLPGEMMVGQMTIANATGFDYKITNASLTYSISGIKRVYNSAAQSSGLTQAQIRDLPANDWWNLCNTFYTNSYGSNWQSNVTALKDLLGSGNALINETSPEYIDIATNYFGSVCYITFDQSGVNAVSTSWSDAQYPNKPPCTLNEYKNQTNTGWMLECLGIQAPMIGSGDSIFQIAIALDGRRTGNAFQDLAIDVNYMLKLERIGGLALAGVNATKVLDTGKPFLDTDEFNILLERDGQVMYEFLLNKNNNWTLTQDIEPGVYIVREEIISGKYKLVKIESDLYRRISGRLTVVSGESANVVVTNTDAPDVITPQKPLVPPTKDETALSIMILSVFASSLILVKKMKIS